MTIKDIIAEKIDSGEDLRLQIFRGELKSVGKLPGAELTFTQTGTARFRGNVTAKVNFTSPQGKDYEIDVNMPLSAWEEDALMLGSLSEGDRVLVLGEYNRRKTQNGEFFTEMNIIAVE